MAANERMLLARAKIQGRIDRRAKWIADPFVNRTNLIRWQAEIRAYKDSLKLMEAAGDGED